MVAKNLLTVIQQIFWPIRQIGMCSYIHLLSNLCVLRNKTLNLEREVNNFSWQPRLTQNTAADLLFVWVTFCFMRRKRFQTTERNMIPNFLTINTYQQGQLSILYYLKNVSCIWFNTIHVPCISQMYTIFLKEPINLLDLFMWLYYIAITNMFQPIMWPSSRWWEQEYKHTYNASKSLYN
jgi:hypothetical protein